MPLTFQATLEKIRTGGLENSRLASIMNLVGSGYRPTESIIWLTVVIRWGRADMDATMIKGAEELLLGVRAAVVPYWVTPR